jgi:tRNA pseudouridine32 synthase/23S rRNA pseudouridine746 synthase
MTHKISDISHFELHITAETTQQTAVDLLAENTPLSKQKIKNTMTNGAVWLESSIGIHRLRRAKKVVENNSVLHLYYDEKIQTTKPDEAILVSDEGEYSIWNKPYGMYSQGTKWGDHCTIYRWAEEHLKPQRPAFLVHRLDRAANGLIILAHTKKTSKAFADLFQKRQIKKQYLATVEGVIDGITLPYTISSKIDNKSAISIITAVKQLNDKKTLVTIEIKTGRKHQIRKHLSEFGYPIIGDRLHGSGLSDNNLQLQSNYLQFNCPITNEMREYSL